MKLKLALGVLVLACAVSPLAMAQMGGGGAPPPTSSSGGSDSGRIGNNADPATAFHAGVVAYNAGDFTEAVRCLRIAQRQMRNNSQINYALGLAYNRAGDANNAKTSFEAAVRDPNVSPDAHAQLGLIYLAQGDRTKATGEQTALSAALTACTGDCGADRHAQLQQALNTLTQALNGAAPAAATTPG